MKAKLIIVAIAIAFFAVSCKKNVQNSISGSLVGKWYYALDTIKSSQNGGPFKILSTLKYTTKTDYIQFNADGTGLNYYNSMSTNFSYTMAGNIITFNYPSTPSSTPGTPANPAYSQQAKVRAVTDSQFNMLFDDVTTYNGTSAETYEAQYFSK